MSIIITTITSITIASIIGTSTIMITMDMDPAILTALAHRSPVKDHVATTDRLAARAVPVALVVPSHPNPAQVRALPKIARHHHRLTDRASSTS